MKDFNLKYTLEIHGGGGRGRGGAEEREADNTGYLNC